ncbi:MAG: hypothetical protein PHI49_10160 [Halothiobacillaceae bacterium]|nr:hypothetical protein [Halothiobacillaceae bacterium]
MPARPQHRLTLASALSLQRAKLLRQLEESPTPAGAAPRRPLPDYRRQLREHTRALDHTINHEIAALLTSAKVPPFTAYLASERLGKLLQAMTQTYRELAAPPPRLWHRHAYAELARSYRQTLIAVAAWIAQLAPHLHAPPSPQTAPFKHRLKLLPSPKKNTPRRPRPGLGFWGWTALLIFMLANASGGECGDCCGSGGME